MESVCLATLLSPFYWLKNATMIRSSGEERTTAVQEAQEYELAGFSNVEVTKSNSIKTVHQIGGQGTVYNMMLAIPSHLNGTSPVFGDAPYNSLEHVMIPPMTARSGKVASVGEHVQGTDEIYYIYRGRGILTTNGDPVVVSAGNLVIAPRGTRHSIANPFSDEPLAFLVIELHAPAASAFHAPMLLESLPISDAPDLQAALYTGPISLRVPRLDLAGYFSAPWGMLSVIELPPSAHIEEYTLPTQDENLFVISGFATFIVADERIDPSENDGHYNVVVPWGIPRRIVNSSIRDTLTILSVRVHRQVEGLSRLRSIEAMMQSV